MSATAAELCTLELVDADGASCQSVRAAEVPMSPRIVFVGQRVVIVAALVHGVTVLFTFLALLELMRVADVGV